MAAPDMSEALAALDQTMRSVETVLDLPAKRREIAALEEEAAVPDLWNDQDNAQRVTSRLSFVQGEVRKTEALRQRLDDLPVLIELAEAEDDADSFAEAVKELDELTKSVGELEVRTLLAGEYDSREALMTIRAEAGGVDAADWAEMLLRMYTRYCERHNWSYDVLDTSYAEEAGIKSATFAIKAPYAYGTLSVEQGTHRLVRISPFDNQGRRQTSFAGVEVLPVVEQTDHIEIPEDELRVDVYRSSGPGGQGVNTTDSAVRITHLPTNIVVSCQNERSQIQNRASAMTVMQSKLLDRRRQEEQAKMDALKGDSTGSWGNQMRSYVLHPYQMVKDLRTETETGNTAAVLDGEIDEFVESAIRWRRTSA
jgi:peptide chain release factor 2